MRKEKNYAFYQNGKMQFHGTIEEISEITLLSKSTLMTYKTPKYLEENKNSNKPKLIEVGYRD